MHSLRRNMSYAGEEPDRYQMENMLGTKVGERASLGRRGTELGEKKLGPTRMDKLGSH